MGFVHTLDRLCTSIMTCSLCIHVFVIN